MIRIELRKEFGGGAPRIDVAMEMEPRAFATLFGASGAGKTTVLRMIAGLTRPDAGRIEAGGEVWFDSARGIDLPPQHRSIGYIFQESALFPNMTVRGNLLYAAAKGDAQWVEQLARGAGLAELMERMPDTLSGGQRQRVALARALVRRPKLLLLDEPLAALDGATRQTLQDELLALHRASDAAALLVSHDLSEVFKMSGAVFMLEEGSITRRGTPMELFGGRNLSGKFRFTGEVVSVEKQDIVYIVTVVVGNTPVSVMATADEVKEFRVGDRVMLLTKAFNPMIVKL